MTENFPNIVYGEGKSHTSSRRAQSPKQMGLKRTKLRHIIIKMAKLKDKERMVKARSEKQLVTYK